MWPSSSSSPSSLWHRCLCWARKRNTATLQRETNRVTHKGFAKQKHLTMNKNQRTVTILYFCNHLLSSAFCRSISFSKSSLCSTKLSMFWRQSLSSSLEKRNTRQQSNSSADIENHPKRKPIRRIIFRAVSSLCDHCNKRRLIMQLSWLTR